MAYKNRSWNVAKATVDLLKEVLKESRENFSMSCLWLPKVAEIQNVFYWFAV